MIILAKVKRSPTRCPRVFNVLFNIINEKQLASINPETVCDMNEVFLVWFCYFHPAGGENVLHLSSETHDCLDILRSVYLVVRRDDVPESSCPAVSK